MKTSHFRFSEVFPDTPEFDAYLALRYQVFCAELNHVRNPHPGGGGICIETDRFDVVSRHWLAIDVATGSAAACCRLILPNPGGLSLESRYLVDHRPYPDASAETTAEISRMALAPAFRRRRTNLSMTAAESGIPDTLSPQCPGGSAALRYQPELMLGLFREMFLGTADAGITHAYAAMTSNFSRLLAMTGFPFLAAGPVNPNFSPPRRPYIISRSAVLRAFARHETFWAPCEEYAEPATSGMA